MHTSFGLKTSAVLCALFLGAAAPLFAGDNDGTAAAAFLRLDHGGRAMAMGGAFSALDHDVEAAWYNPAGVALLNSYQINFGYSYLFEDISNSYAAFGIPVGEERTDTVIAQVNHVNLGSVDARDATGAALNSASAYGLALSLGYARSMTSNFSIGVLAKNVIQNLGTDSGSAFAFDAGAQLKVLPELILGFAMQNLGSKMKTADYENPIPTTMRLGAAYAVSPRAVIALDGEKPSDSDLAFRLGTELAVSRTVSFRAGYNTRESAGFTAGIGLLTPISLDTVSLSRTTEDWEHNAVRIDYAYVNVGNLDVTHRLSLTLKL